LPPMIAGAIPSNVRTASIISTCCLESSSVKFDPDKRAKTHWSVQTNPHNLISQVNSTENSVSGSILSPGAWLRNNTYRNVRIDLRGIEQHVAQHRLDKTNLRATEETTIMPILF